MDDKGIELTYIKQGDYYIPDLKLPEQPDVELGRYAQMRRQYLREKNKILYCNLLTTCKLTEHLAETEQRAMELEETLIKQMAEKEGVTEELKANDMMSWVRKMNSIRSRAEEIVKAEVIFA